MALAVASTETRQPGSKRPIWLIGGVVAVVAALVVVLIIMLAGSSNSPKRLLFGISGGVSARPAVRPIWYDSAIQAQGSVPDGRIDMLSIKPNIINNTAHGQISLWTCDKRTSLTVGSGRPTGCRTLRPFRAATLHLQFSRTVILVRVAPQAAGRVRIHGFDVRYRNGSDTVEQRAGMVLDLMFKTKHQHTPAH